MIENKTGTSANTVRADFNLPGIGCPYWLKLGEDNRWKLCKKSHPELVEDTNVNYVDCQYAFEGGG